MILGKNLAGLMEFSREDKIMPQLLGIRIGNYKSLQNVTLGQIGYGRVIPCLPLVALLDLMDAENLVCLMHLASSLIVYEKE